jgi:hypothetical protein
MFQKFLLREYTVCIVTYESHQINFSNLALIRSQRNRKNFFFRTDNLQNIGSKRFKNFKINYMSYILIKTLIVKMLYIELNIEVWNFFKIVDKIHQKDFKRLYNSLLIGRTIYRFFNVFTRIGLSNWSVELIIEKEFDLWAFSLSRWRSLVDTVSSKFDILTCITHRISMFWSLWRLNSIIRVFIYGLQYLIKINLLVKCLLIMIKCIFYFLICYFLNFRF